MHKIIAIFLSSLLCAAAMAADQDSDFDGVPDDRDLCPNTPRYVYTNPQGCAPDSDGDGLPDAVDRCPGTRSGAEIDQYGCDIDKDGDGVQDYADMCPDTKPDTKVNAAGCSQPQVVALKGVTFEKGSARLTVDSRAILDGAAEKLRNHPGLKVEVAGYTDNLGKDSVNQWLSQNRAEAVRNYLVSQGVSAQMLSARGYGPANPIASNATEEGQAANRRVELHILE